MCYAGIDMHYPTCMYTHQPQSAEYGSLLTDFLEIIKYNDHVISFIRSLFADLTMFYGS